MINKDIIGHLVHKYLEDFKEMLGQRKHRAVELLDKIKRNEEMESKNRVKTKDHISKLSQWNKYSQSELLKECINQFKGNEAKLYMEQIGILANYVEQAANSPKYRKLFGTTNDEVQHVSELVTCNLSLILLKHYNGIEDYDDETFIQYLKIFMNFSNYMIQQADGPRLAKTVLEATGHALYSLLIIIDNHESVNLQ